MDEYMDECMDGCVDRWLTKVYSIEVDECMY